MLRQTLKPRIDCYLQAKLFNQKDPSGVGGGLHSTEVAGLLLAQQPRE